MIFFIFQFSYFFFILQTYDDDEDEVDATIESENFNYPMSSNESRFGNRGGLRRSHSFAMPTKFNHENNSSNNLHRSLSRQSFASQFQVKDSSQQISAHTKKKLND